MTAGFSSVMKLCCQSLVGLTFATVESCSLWTMAGLVKMRRSLQVRGLRQLGSNGIEIAQWVEDASGYPCSHKLCRRKFFCSDKMELEVHCLTF